nr:FapA family protein [Motiliproteus sediminis]
MLAESDFKHFKPQDDAIRTLIDSAARAADTPLTEQVFLLAQRVDAVLELVVSENQMACEARITTGYGGEPITAKRFKQALQESGVRMGIDTAVASALMKQAYRAEPGSIHKAIIARGRAADKGKNGRWVSEVTTVRPAIENPKMREDGSVDLLDFGEILSVAEGTSLMHLEPPTPGVPGFTVTGKKLPADPGSPAKFVAAEGVTLAPDQQHILAARSGMPVEVPGGIRVDNVYKVKQVNLETGHIEFDGTVIIQGDVCDMMKVVASGDVMVGGSVQSARIEAGGDLTVRKGVIGHQRTEEDELHSDDLTCELMARGRMQLGFAQYARLESGGGIYVDTQLLHCVITTATELVIGREGTRNSNLIGGISRVGKRVVCGNYGTDAFVPTTIELRPNTHEIDQQVRQLTEASELKQQQLAEIKATLPQLSTLPKTPENKKSYNAALKQSLEVGNAAVALDQQLKALEEQKKALLAHAWVVARGTIYPGVSVVIPPYIHKTHREHQGGGIRFEQGEIRYDPALAE